MNDVLPWSDPPRSKSEDLRSPRMEPGAAAKATEARATRWPSNARLVSVVSAGVKGLLASQSTAADTIRDLVRNRGRERRSPSLVDSVRGGRGPPCPLLITLFLVYIFCVATDRRMCQYSRVALQMTGYTGSFMGKCA